MQKQTKAITIRDIVLSKGAARTRKLNAFLKTCTERQRAFLLFYGFNPLIIPDDCVFTEEIMDKIYATIKDVKDFRKWDSLGDTMRDLYLKMYITRESAGKALSYISAYVTKIDDAIAAANIINKALTFVPEGEKICAFSSMKEEYNKTSTLAVEGDTAEVGIVFNTDTQKAEADTTEARKMIDVAVSQYIGMIGELKAFEISFDKLAESIGEDAYWIYPDRLDVFLWVFREENTFTIAYKNRLPNIDIDIPMLKDAPINQYSYNYLERTLSEWM